MPWVVTQLFPSQIDFAACVSVVDGEIYVENPTRSSWAKRAACVAGFSCVVTSVCDVNFDFIDAFDRSSQVDQRAVSTCNDDSGRVGNSILSFCNCRFSLSRDIKQTS